MFSRTPAARACSDRSVAGRALAGRLTLTPFYAPGMNRRAAAWLLSTVVSLAALAPAASAVQINPAVQLTALSCASTGNCSAIGSYDDGLGHSQALLATETAGAWHPSVEAQAPAGAATTPFKSADGGGLVNIACPAAGNCVAVGRYTAANHVDHAVIFTESGGTWHRGVGVRLPADALPPKPPKAGVVDNVGLSSVACTSVGNCVAVGDYRDDAEVWEALILVERNGRWLRGIRAPLPAGASVQGQAALLLSISCRAANGCSAAGDYVDAHGHQQALLVSGSGSHWSAAQPPQAPADASTDPTIAPGSIACAAAGQCSAVGTYLNPLQNSLGLLLNESAGSWSGAAGVVLPADAAPAGTVGDQTVVLSSVACPQAGACSSVGWYFDNYGNGQPLLVSQNDGVWQPGVRAQLPANAVSGLQKQSAGFDWVSCATAGNCLATGVYTDIGYNSQGLLVSEVGGVWQPGVESPLPANAAMLQYAAANQSDCTGAGDCTVIGTYNDRLDNVLGYTLSERSGNWGPASELTLPAPNATETRLSLAAILTPGHGGAKLAAIRKARGYRYQYQAVEAGTARSSWSADLHGRRRLIASGSVRVKAPGTKELKLKLTALGTRLLADVKRVHVSVTASFRPRGSRRVERVRGQFTLN